MRDSKGTYLTGALIGVLLVVAPWWITVSCAAIIITWMVLKNDKPTQVQARRERAQKKASAVQHAGGHSYSDFEEGEHTWQYL